ncbi:helix-turn-helix domain-containing protein [Streptomyces sp. NPDC091377]|uniref:helix-turn-helix domain-containing protein n=1 Tax=unclassified Streptomyces TaxID=2593676 RepID=UPI00380BB1EC
MVKQVPDTTEPEEGNGPKAGRRGAVRYLQNETAPSASRMVLGNALRHRRNLAGLKLEEVAKRLGVSSSKVSRIESGSIPAKEQDLLRLFAVYRIEHRGDQEELLELSQVAKEAAWWQPWSAITPKYLQAVVSFEDMAQRIRSYESQYLYGLLQTPEYARALIERGRGPVSAHDDLVDFRAKRQQRFAAAPGKTLIAVVDEAALRRPIGSVDIMRGQVQHLIELTRNPRYQLRLAELGRFGVPVELGSTTVFDFESRLLPTIACMEGFDGSLAIDDDQMVDRRAKMFDALRARALGPHAMRRKLQDMLSSGLYR